MAATATLSNKTVKSARKRAQKFTVEDLQIMQTLEKLKADLDYLDKIFDYVTDPVLTDSYAYEILSVKMKYTYYLSLCKERGLVST